MRPPALDEEDPRSPAKDRRYMALRKEEIPLAECLKDTVERFLPCWHDLISSAVRAGKRVVVTAHGNSLRALVKYLDGISDEAITELNIPTGMPLVYELDDALRPLRNYYLGEAEKVKKAMEAVASQGKAKK